MDSNEPGIREAATPLLRPQPLVVVLAAAVCGIVLNRVLPISWPVSLTLGAVFLGVWLLAINRRAHRTSSIALLAAVSMLAASWHDLQWNQFPESELGRAADDAAKPVALRLVATQPPTLSPAPTPDPMRILPSGDLSRLDVKVLQVRDGDTWVSASGCAELTVDGHLLQIEAGDRLEAMAYLRAHAGPMNPGEFDYAGQHRGERRLFSLHAVSPDAIKVREAASWWDARRLRGSLRERCHRLLWSHLHDRQAVLAEAILLGARDAIERDRKERFFVTGTVHLLAISGLHVGILAMGLDFLLRCFALPRRNALALTMLLVVCYAFLVDARPPVIRATILVVAFCVARFGGRPTNGYNTLAAAALIVLAISPAALFSTGAQLSFLAVATIVTAAPLLYPSAAVDPLSQLIQSTRPWPVRAAKTVLRTARFYTVMSATIWLAAIPLTAYRFHVVAPIALVLNPLLSIPMAFSLFSGFAILATGWASPLLGDVCGGICEANLSLLEGMVSGAESVPGGHFWTAGPAGWWVAATYALLAAYLALPRIRPPRHWLGVIAIAWIAAGLWLSPTGQRHMPRNDDVPLECIVTSVGHGESILLDLPDGRTILYDAGCMMSPRSAAKKISATLWSKGINQLDAVVLSHADADHYNALPDLLERFHVQCVYVSPMMFQQHTEALTSLRDVIQRANVPIHQLCKGDRFSGTGDVRIEVLHPPEGGVPGGDNANSIVLCITHQRRRVVLTGDLQGAGLDGLICPPTRSADIFVVPHHGSVRNVRPDVLEWVRPTFSIVSGGVNDDAPELRTAYSAIGSRVLHTAHDGAVLAIIDRQGVRAQAWRREKW